MPPDYCPQCGAEIPPRATSCPECGSCEETGWSDRSRNQALGLPDDEFDYDDYVKREFEPKSRILQSGRRIWVSLVALGLLALFAWTIMR